MPVLCYLPWLELGEELAVGNTRFVPYVREKQPFDPKTQRQAVADHFLSPYHTDRDTPIARAAIVAPTGELMPDELTPSVREEVVSDVSILCLAAIARNDYFNQLGKYSNASAFVVLFQNIRSLDGDLGAVGITTRRRDGHLNAIWPVDMLLHSLPPGVTSVQEAAFDGPLYGLFGEKARHRDGLGEVGGRH